MLPNRKSAFTLIELLTVIAVIAILFSIIVAGIPAIRDRANQTAAVANLREIGVSMRLYASENDNRLPAAAWESEHNWLKSLYTFVYEREFPFDEFYSDGRVLEGTIFWSPVLSGSTETPLRSFGFNGYTASLGRINMLSIEDPAKLALMGDAERSSNLYVSRVAYRNSGKANILFADGHIATLAPEQIPSKSSDPFWRP